MSISWLPTTNGHSPLLRDQTYSLVSWLPSIQDDHFIAPLSPQTTSTSADGLISVISEKTNARKMKLPNFHTTKSKPYLNLSPSSPSLLRLRSPPPHVLWTHVLSVLCLQSFSPKQHSHQHPGNSSSSLLELQEVLVMFVWHATQKFNTLNNGRFISQECEQGSIGIAGVCSTWYQLELLDWGWGLLFVFWYFSWGHSVSWGLAGGNALLSSPGLFHVSGALVLHVASLSMWCLTHQDLSPRDISF